MGSASVPTQAISMPCPETTVPMSPNGVDQTSRAWPGQTLKTSGAGAGRILDRHEIQRAGRGAPARRDAAARYSIRS